MTDGRPAPPRPAQPADIDMRRREAFGRRLRELRHSRGWTQGELAERSGLAPDAIRAIELGGGTVRLDAIWTLADALDCRPGDLLRSDNRTAGD